MDSSKVQKRGLRSSALPFLVLAFADVIQITLFSFGAQGLVVVLTVYVDDILLTGSDSAGIVETKIYLKRHFVTKDIGRPKYFLRIEVAHQKYSVFLSQRKYVVDLLEETGLSGCKLANTPIEANVDLWFDNNHTLDDPRRYRRLLGKLIYLTVIRPDITFAVGV